MKSHFNPTPGSTKRRPLAVKLFQFSSPPFWDRERLSASNPCLSAWRSSKKKAATGAAFFGLGSRVGERNDV